MANPNDSPFDDLDLASQARQSLATLLSKMLEALRDAELQGKAASGSLELNSDIEELEIKIENLENGVFRLLTLGDVKRGKSTLLNAIVGEKEFLPTDVNPCTALLTILRYGRTKKVTVHFNDGKPPEILDLQTFKARYTLKPDEAKRLEEQNKRAFEDVEQAIVECPLDILQKGVEIIDSPGLNDTKELNALTLGYVRNCHATLFVLSATQQLTEGERDYLDSKLLKGGLTVFFLINRWDEILHDLRERSELEDNPKEFIQKGEEKVRQFFRNRLSQHFNEQNDFTYEKRVFEISALKALKSRLKGESLEGTSFSNFLEELVFFLNHDKLPAELLPAVSTARNARKQVHEAVQRRIPLLKLNLEELEGKINDVQPLFEQLGDIRNNFNNEIKRKRSHHSEKIADSFVTYLKSLDSTFESDFHPYQPELKGTGKKSTEEFLEKMKGSFKRYLEAQIEKWSLRIEQDLQGVFASLSDSGYSYALSYERVKFEITQKLIDSQDKGSNLTVTSGSSSLSSSVNMSNISNPDIGKVGAVRDGIIGGILGGMWGAGIGSFISLFLIQIGITAASAIFLPIIIPGIIGIPWLAKHAVDEARKYYISQARNHFASQLPDLAEKTRSEVLKSVEDSFDTFVKVVQQMDKDIQSQKKQLDNLVIQKKNRQVDNEAEEKRLQALDETISKLCSDIESAYTQFTGRVL